MKQFKTQTEKQLHQILNIFITKAYTLLKNEYGFLMTTDELAQIKEILMKRVLSGNEDYFGKALSDMSFIYEKDPALKDKEEREAVIYKSLPLLLLHRIAHDIYKQNPAVARYLSEVNRQLTQAEIHPGATIGTEIFIDHPTGLIVGETAVVGDRFHSFGHVLLGNDGKRFSGRRHPHVANNVTISPHTVVLGAVTVEDNVVIGADSTVTVDVPKDGVVFGVNRLSRIGAQKMDIPLKEYWQRVRGS